MESRVENWEYGDSKVALEILKEFFPERGMLLLQILLKGNKESKKIEKWREQQMVKFIFAVTYNVDELVHGFMQKRIWKIAWAARNLLELNVWISYCDSSISRAKQFRDDSARDMLGVSKVLQSAMMQHHGIENPELAATTKRLVKMAETKLGVPQLKDDYTRVSDAAEELGGKKDFLHANKLLSKYAHPTAIALNSTLPESAQFDEGIRDMFLSEGTEYSMRGIRTLRDRILYHFPRKDENSPSK